MHGVLSAFKEGEWRLERRRIRFLEGRSRNRSCGCEPNLRGYRRLERRTIW